MTRKFKALGLALFATLALGAVMASAASATEFTAASYPVKYTGTQASTEPHVFTADTYETTCKDASFSGEAEKTSTTATLTPVYKECTAFGLSATVNMNGCDYLFHLGAEGNNATVDLVCPAGKDVTITAGGGACVAHIAPFAGKGSVALSNAELTEPTRKVIKAAADVANIGASLTDVSSFFCPFGGNTNTATATYTGNLTLEGSSNIDIG